MRMKTIEEIAKNPEKQWYYTLSELSVILGRNVKYIRAFLHDHAVPYYKIGKTASYFLPDVLDAVEKTKFKS